MSLFNSQELQFRKQIHDKLSLSMVFTTVNMDVDQHCPVCHDIFGLWNIKEIHLS